MSNASMQDKALARNDHDAVLREIGTKWDKFSEQELSVLKSNDDLVSQVINKYGLEQKEAQREVDSLLAGRSLTP